MSAERAGTAREALRQQQLLRVLWRRADEDSLHAWLRGPQALATQGLAAYRGNAAAVAERALAATFPTVQQLLGEASFAALSGAFWHRHAPQHGDLAQWGGELPAFIEGDDQLASEPYLGDCARVDWAAHGIEHAADVDAQPLHLVRLGSDDPAQIGMHLRPGLTLLHSVWPVVTLWHAHRSTQADRFVAVRAAFELGRGEHALIWRDGWRGSVAAVDDATAALMQQLLAGASLAAALDAAGARFSFESWLAQALAKQWIAAVVDAAGGAQAVARA